MEDFSEAQLQGDDRAPPRLALERGDEVLDVPGRAEQHPREERHGVVDVPEGQRTERVVQRGVLPGEDTSFNLWHRTINIKRA